MANPRITRSTTFLRPDRTATRPSGPGHRTGQAALDRARREGASIVLYHVLDMSGDGRGGEAKASLKNLTPTAAAAVAAKA